MPRCAVVTGAFVAFVAIGTSLHAQGVMADSARRVVPGDSGLHGAQLAPGVKRYALTLFQDGDELPVGTLLDSLWVDSTAGAVTVRRIKTLQRGPVRLVDSTITEWATLAPRLHQSQLPTRRVRLEFSGRRVKGMLAPQDLPPVPIDTTLAQLAFDASSWDLVAAALPLAPGFVARFPVYDVDAGLRLYQLAVTGKTTINGEESWVVTLTLARGRESVVWIGMTSRRVLKMETTMGTTILIQQLR